MLSCIKGFVLGHACLDAGIGILVRGGDQYSLGALLGLLGGRFNRDSPALTIVRIRLFDLLNSRSFLFFPDRSGAVLLMRHRVRLLVAQLCLDGILACLVERVIAEG